MWIDEPYRKFVLLRYRQSDYIIIADNNMRRVWLEQSSIILRIAYQIDVNIYHSVLC